MTVKNKHKLHKTLRLQFCVRFCYDYAGLGLDDLITSGGYKCGIMRTFRDPVS